MIDSLPPQPLLKRGAFLLVEVLHRRPRTHTTTPTPPKRRGYFIGVGLFRRPERKHSRPAPISCAPLVNRLWAAMLASGRFVALVVDGTLPPVPLRSTPGTRPTMPGRVCVILSLSQTVRFCPQSTVLANRITTDFPTPLTGHGKVCRVTHSRKRLWITLGNPIDKYYLVPGGSLPPGIPSYYR